MTDQMAILLGHEVEARTSSVMPTQIAFQAFPFVRLASLFTCYATAFQGYDNGSRRALPVCKLFPGQLGEARYHQMGSSHFLVSL
jgi:hypothetical protein